MLTFYCLGTNHSPIPGLVKIEFKSPESPIPTSCRSMFASGLAAAGQTSETNASRVAQINPWPLKKSTDDLKQELDANALVWSRIPADPLIQPDPLAPLIRSFDKLLDRSVNSLRLKLNATYTFLNQYATITPGTIRHNQLSGRLDYTVAWSAYDHGSTAGSVSLLVRSGANIGRSQQFNLSDQLGSVLYLNCLQGGGPQEPITLNILYWRQDLFDKRLSFYVGKSTRMNM
jgi:porin